jgi:ribosomal protein S18 acetylase RimI-like enzyme
MNETTAAALTATETLTVRQADPSEYEAIADLTERAFAAGPYGHLERSPERRQLERDSEGRARAGVLLAAIAPDGTVVGSSSVLRAEAAQARLAESGEAELRLLVVDPAGQGSGAGELLVKASIEVARSWGVRAVVLDTGSLNVTGQRLYLRSGFQRQTQREAAISTGSGPVPYVYSYDLDDHSGIRIRLIRSPEIEAVSELVETANTNDYSLSDGYRRSLRDVASRAREHEVWVAEDLATGTVLGSVATPRPGQAISELAGEGELDFRFLAVSPAARGRGVGDLLTRHVLQLAAERGVKRVVLNSGPKMVAAHRLYYRVGFELMPDRFVEIVDGPETFTLLAFGLDL